MKKEELKKKLLILLARVAPEADLGSLAEDEPLQQSLDLDSFDYLNFLVAVRDELGVTIEESDYGSLRTLDDLVRFIEPRIDS